MTHRFALVYGQQSLTYPLHNLVDKKKKRKLNQLKQNKNCRAIILFSI